MRVLISWYNWQDKFEQSEEVEVDNIQQGELAGQYKCEVQGFDHYKVQILEKD